MGAGLGVFGVKEAEAAIGSVFAPWIAELGIRPVGFDAKGGDFVLPANDRLVHIGGVVCGQATASAADTCAVLTLAAANGRFRRCTTVDLTTHFIRPLAPRDVAIRVDLLQNGRRMAYVRVEMRAAEDERLAVSATGAFAYLED